MKEPRRESELSGHSAGRGRRLASAAVYLGAAAGACGLIAADLTVLAFSSTGDEAGGENVATVGLGGAILIYGGLIGGVSGALAVRRLGSGWLPPPRRGYAVWLGASAGALGLTMIALALHRLTWPGCWSYGSVDWRDGCPGSADVLLAGIQFVGPLLGAATGILIARSFSVRRRRFERQSRS